MTKTNKETGTIKMKKVQLKFTGFDLPSQFKWREFAEMNNNGVVVCDFNNYGKCYIGKNCWCLEDNSSREIATGTYPTKQDFIIMELEE
jgi:hypothetical protein